MKILFIQILICAGLLVVLPVLIAVYLAAVFKFGSWVFFKICL